MDCPRCDGKGEIEIVIDCRPTEDTGGMSESSKWVECDLCHGTGIEPASGPDGYRG